MKHTYLYKTGLFLLFLCTALWAAAQGKDSLIRNNEIDVYKPFKPILSEAIKIPTNPNPEKPEFVKPVFTYQVPQMQYKAQPTLYIIKPLSMGTMLLPKLKGNYIKVGYANYNMPLIDVYLNTVRNKEYQAGVSIHHLSGNGDQAYNNFSNSSAQGYVKKFAEKSVHALEATYARNAVNLYGSPNDVLTLSTEPKQVFHLLDIRATSNNYVKDSSDKLAYKTKGYFYHFDNSGGFNESDFGASVTLNKSNNQLPFELQAGLRFNNNALKDSAQNWNNYQRIYFDLNPQVYLSGKEFSLMGGFNSTIASDSAGSKFHFFPKAEASYIILPKKLSVFGGFTGNLKPVTLRNIYTENPFVANIALKNTITNIEVYGGLKGELGEKTSFVISSSSAKIENMVTYTKDSANAWQYLTYDTGKAKQTTLSLAMQHQMNEKFRLGFLANVYGYQMSSISKAYSLPQFEIKLNTDYNIGDKFLLKLNLIYWGERFSRVDAYRADGSFNGTTVKMKPFADLNMGIDYRYSKNLSAFLNFNNIANNRYQRYYSYPVYGINIMGGFTFTF